jgi:YVTN family beta-propeller protein
MKTLSKMITVSFVAVALLAGCGGGGGGSASGNAAVGATSTVAKVYVANSGAKSVTVLDAGSYASLSTITVGTNPSAIAVNNTTNRAYVANTDSGNVSVIDTLSDNVVATVVTGTNPAGVAVNPLTNRAYITNAGDNKVSVLDTNTNTVVASITVDTSPVGITVNPAANRVYVANFSSGTVSVIDTVTNSVVKTISIGVGTFPYGIVADPMTTRVYVTQKTSNRIAVIDTATNSVTPVIVGLFPAGLAINPNDNKVFVANSTGNSLSMIGANSAVLVTAGGRPGPEALAVNPQNNYLYVANKTDNSINVVDPMDQNGFGSASSFKATVAVGAAPAAIAIAVTNQALPQYPALPNVGITWSVQPNHVNTDNLTSVATDSTQYVAVGAGGKIKSSPDGIIWTVRTSGTTTSLTHISYQNGRFIALGAAGTILTSPDGITWTSRTSGTTMQLNGVTFGAGQYVAVGASGTVLTSPDSVTWTTRNSGVTANLNGITFANAQYLAVGDGATLLASTNGISWTANNNANIAATRNIGTSSAVASTLKSITYANGKYVAVGGDPGNVATQLGITGRIITSTDSLTWTSVYPTGGMGTPLNHVLFANGKFVAAVPDMKGCYVSADGVAWAFAQPAAQQTQFSLLEITYANGRYVGVGSAGNIGISTDASNWSRINTGTNNPITSLAFANGKFVALSANEALYTSDAVTTLTRSPEGNFYNPTMMAAGMGGVGYNIRYLNGLYIAVDNQGRVVTSPDAVTWTEHSIPGLTVNGALTAAAYGNGRYVVVGMNGIIATSTDAVTWSASSSIATTRYFFDVQFLNGTFFAIGQGGMTYTSTDGITWSSRAVIASNYNSTASAYDGSFAHTPAEFRSIAYGNGMYVIVGMNNSLNSNMGGGNSYFASVLTSTDGINWTERSDSADGISNGLQLPGIVSYDRVIFANGTFIALCRSKSGSNTGSVLTSRDGIHWADRTPAGMAAFRFEDVAFGNGTLMLVGGSGLGSLIMTSP